MIAPFSSSALIELIGWASSVVLLATLLRQVLVQYRSGSVGGLSKWLFVGQMAASVGFAVYSWLLKNWVFTFSNLAILVVAVAGECLYAKNRSKSPPRSAQPASSCSDACSEAPDNGSEDQTPTRKRQSPAIGATPPFLSPK